MLRKTRCDSVLENLPVEQQEQLQLWLMDEGIGLKEARDRLKQEFNVEVGRDPLSRYFRKLSGWDALEEMSEMAALVKELPPNWRAEAEEIRAMSQYLMLQRIRTTLLTGKIGPDQLYRLGKLLIKLEQMAQKEKADLRKEASEKRRDESWSKTMAAVVEKEKERKSNQSREAVSNQAGKAKQPRMSEAELVQELQQRIRLSDLLTQQLNRIQAAHGPKAPESELKSLEEQRVKLVKDIADSQEMADSYPLSPKEKEFMVAYAASLRKQHAAVLVSLGGKGEMGRQ